jgi:2-oxoglutarate ferredoxin oxidoreductase subunit gamma
MGKMLAVASMKEGRKVTWFPSYGAEMRGGTANCTVVISDEMIGSPVVLRPDILVVMNKASFDKFQPVLKKKGLFFYDSSLIMVHPTRTDITPVPVPATQIASSAGNTRSANMVMLGALAARTGMLSEASVAALFENPQKDLRLDINRQSLMKGMAYIEDKKG